MIPPHNRSINQLAIEVGISEATLYNWRQQALAKGSLLPDGDTGPEGWAAQDRFAVVMESASLNEEDCMRIAEKKRCSD